LDQKAVSSERFKEKISGVSEVLQNQNVSGQTTAKIKEFYMNLYPSKQVHDDQEILADMPFAFSSEVQRELLTHFVKSSAFFCGVHETVYLKVCTSLYFVRADRVSMMMHGEEIKQAIIT
jgi:hypothetical protein